MATYRGRDAMTRVNLPRWIAACDHLPRVYQLQLYAMGDLTIPQDSSAKAVHRMPDPRLMAPVMVMGELRRGFTYDW